MNYIGTNQRDKVTGFPVGITGDHTYIHKGQAFTLQVEETIAAGASVLFYFKTPATRYVHLRPTRLSSTANLAEVRLLESAVLNVAGTVVTPYNRNRISSNASQAVIQKGATFTDEGDLLEVDFAGSASGGAARSGGSVDGSAEELVLKRDTVYLIKLSNIGSSTASSVGARLFWYEEDEGLS